MIEQINDMKKKYEEEKEGMNQVLHEKENEIQCLTNELGIVNEQFE